VGRFRDIVIKLGRSAGQFILSQPQVQRQVDKVTDRIKESRENVESWLINLEEELWVWVRRMQDEAQRAHTHVDRAKNANTYYRTLGLNPGANLDEVKQAWRKAMRKNHPDLFAHDPVAERAAHTRSQELNTAYTELCALLSGRQRSL
jgi:DnaJ-domain-containing protein 1